MRLCGMEGKGTADRMVKKYADINDIFEI